MVFEEEALLKDACDVHMHTSPSMFLRRLDHFEAARQAREAGMRSIVLKCHHAGTADRAILVRKVVPGIDVFGSVVLNYPLGALNPFAVDVAIRWGAKIVWMPTFDSRYNAKFLGSLGASLRGLLRVSGAALWPGYRGREGISILTDKGEMVPEMEEILNLIAEADIAIATGHLSVEEIDILVREAKNVGINKVIIDHPYMIVNLSIEKQEELVKLGAFIEYVYATVSPYFHDIVTPGTNISVVTDAIKRVGAEHCILATDAGTVQNPLPVECLRLFIRMLLDKGVTAKEVESMVRNNPAFLLGLK